ncbi:diguanylate cyclase [bacterium]|nr:diguanylate cyclase [bacterium]
MGIFKGLRDILGQINKVDSSIYVQGRNFADVYAKNIALEEEIAARTQELEQANQTLLTLNGVWEMMNSSQPLSSMLDKIVNVLHEDMGYIYAAIVKVEKENEAKISIEIKASAPYKNIDDMYSITQEGVFYDLEYWESSIIAKSIRERKLYSTPDVMGVIKILFPQLNEEQIKESFLESSATSCNIVPLHNEKENWGCLIVTSDRPQITDTEANFLSLYASQLGLGITVANLFEEVRKQAITDPLTGLYNRRYFEENIVKEAERSLRLNQPFSLISLDLDYLKRINDTYGHQFGDIAIKTISNVLKKEARSIDIPARIGGEEFNLLLPGVDSKGAAIAAERIRKSIENQVIDTIGGVTASIGVATFLEHSDRIDELTEMADQAMYKAKLNGRNQVYIAQVHEDEDWQNIAVDTFLDIFAKKRIPVDENIAKSLYQKLQDIKEENNNPKDILYSIVDTISKTYNHTYRKGTTKSKQMLAIMLAKRLELPKDEIDKLKLAILLYDIGNIMIPENILNKKEPLTEEEKNIIKQHPVIAAREILKPISNIQDIIPIIENHHENWNGKGYPEHKSGIEIPITSQIVLLVDAFSAMSQDRPYRPAYSREEIIEILKKEAGQQWNNQLVDDFIYLIENERI